VGTLGITEGMEQRVMLRGYGIQIEYATAPPEGQWICDAISGATGDGGRNADAFVLSVITDSLASDAARDGRTR
jgi:hypothetical protein